VGRKPQLHDFSVYFIVYIWRRVLKTGNQRWSKNGCIY